jgi:hypothetical protein
MTVAAPEEIDLSFLRTRQGLKQRRLEELYAGLNSFIRTCEVGLITQKMYFSLHNV